MGKAVLEGLEGVKKVTRGFRGFREINTVTYDPDVIGPEQMVAALKMAGTYIGPSHPDALDERMGKCDGVSGTRNR